MAKSEKIVNPYTGTDKQDIENIMEQKKDEIEINPTHLFNDLDLKFMRAILEKHKKHLDSVSDYKKLVKKIYTTANKIEQTNREVYNLFEDYYTTSNEISEYELCLMFYLGFRKGLEVKKME